MKKLILSMFSMLSLVAVAQELPTDAVPGKCYIKCITADEFREETETITISPAFKKLRTVPATFKTVEEEVMVKEATTKKVFIPAVFETVMVEVTSDANGNSDGSGNGGGKAVNYQVVPAEFSKDMVSVETQPKIGKWEYTQLKDCPSANKEDCMVACFVESGPKNMNISITTLRSDARVEEVPIPGSTVSYKKQIVKEQPRMEDIPVPAQYATIKRRVIERPAQVIEEEVSAVTKTVTKTILSKKGGMTVWEEVDCGMASGSNILPINYETNSALLSAESKALIDENLVTLMRNKSGLRIEIASHTDARSDDSYNMALSQQRAQSVVNYLVSNGISRNRLVAKGYGESRLKNNCGNGANCSDEQHYENRRTEFRILR